MPHSRPARVSGLLLLAGGIVGAIVPLSHPNHGPAYYADPMTSPVHLLLLAAVLLVSLGLPGLVNAQPERWRTWAAVAAALVFTGEWLLDGTHAIVDGAITPALVQQGIVDTSHGGAHGMGLAQALSAGPLGTLVDVGVPTLILGCIALGTVLFRARTVPRAAALLLALCWVLVPVSFIVPGVRGFDVALPYVAFGVLGLTSMLGGTRTSPAASPAATRESSQPRGGDAPTRVARFATAD